LSQFATDEEVALNRDPCEVRTKSDKIRFFGSVSKASSSLGRLDLGAGAIFDGSSWYRSAIAQACGSEEYRKGYAYISSSRHRHWENARPLEPSVVWRDSDTIAKRDNASGVRWNTLARNYDANEIQRICCVNCRNFAGRILFTPGSQRFNGHGQSELLAHKPTDESAGTDFPAVFQTSQSDHYFTPFQKYSFAR